MRDREDASDQVRVLSVRIRLLDALADQRLVGVLQQLLEAWEGPIIALHHELALDEPEATRRDLRRAASLLIDLLLLLSLLLLLLGAVLEGVPSTMAKLEEHE